MLGTIVTVCTLGICYPWALTLMYGWKIIDGQRMQFHGSTLDLFDNWIKWLLLAIGIYSFWVNIKLEAWKAKKTSFA
nr:hypothetical protein [Loigolactobacillus zhaoyuanensis]